MVLKFTKARIFTLISVALLTGITIASVNTSAAKVNAESVKETPALQAHLLFRLGVEASTGILKIRARYKAELKDISFETDELPDYKNPNCISATCKVFNEQGGEVKYRKPIAEFLDQRYKNELNFGKWIFVGNVCVEGIGTGKSDCFKDGINNEEIVAFLPWVQKSICEALEKPSGRKIPIISANTTHKELSKFQGSFSDGLLLASYENGKNILDGISGGCFEGSEGSIFPANSYHYFLVLGAQ